MDTTKIVKRFEEILAKPVKKHQQQRNEISSPEYDHSSAVEWMTDARAALESTFPQTHAVLKQWDLLTEPMRKYGPHLSGSKDVVHGLRAVFQSALSQVKNGYLSALIDGIRAESVSELLDQAESLSSKHVIAATVLAGGALETHLLHLCRKNNIQLNGTGSIEAYNQAISSERNKNSKVIYSPTDTKIITSWGGYRNNAAHQPTECKIKTEEVKLMIEGIRQFIARTEQ